MTDTPVENPVETPEASTEESTQRRKRRPPVGRVVDKIPVSRKTSTWDVEFEWFVQNPGSVKEYKDISQTTPSYLRSRYGLKAVGRNTHDKRVDMYVVYIPEEAEAIKAKAAGKKRQPRQVEQPES